MILGWIALALAVLAAEGPAEAGHSVQQDEAQVLHIPRVSRPPSLEDFLEGRPREREAVVSTFLQRAPRDGEPVSLATTAYLSYDDRRLYVVFVCKDERDQIRARMSPRDTIDTDDLVGVYLDTFHDRQRAYFFKANPFGIQADSIVTEGQDPDSSWDTLWYSRGRIVEDGYVIWMAIPFSSLRFANAEAQVWGLGLTRYIQRNNEDSYWPYITDRLSGLVPHFAAMDGVQSISSRRTVEVIPHAVFTGARVLETSGALPAIHRHDDPGAGADVKIVLRDSLTFDATVNPEFSQVETNDPQVTINQRFEVFFPEKRPFFLENAGFFQTPETFFFSRRIVDPQAGLRLTGKAGSWAFGALAIDDRAPAGNTSGDDGHGDRAFNAAVRGTREFANRSTLGFLATSHHVGSSSNQVAAADGRWLIGDAWAITAQAGGSRAQHPDGTAAPGFAGVVQADRTGLHVIYLGKYIDRSPGFESDLGFIPRVDIRSTSHVFAYSWRPSNSSVVSYGPRFVGSGNWDRRRDVQDWSAEPAFHLELRGPTIVDVTVARSFERFQNLPFDKTARTVSFSTDRWTRLGFAVTHAQGDGVNYYPGPAFAGPAPAHFIDTSLTMTMRPVARLRLDEIYLFNRLTSDGDATIFNSQTLRSKSTLQFTPALSLRAILDYNGVAPDESLVALERSKRLAYDLLVSYVPHPGTALYLGFTDTYENLRLLDGSPALTRIGAPSLSTGRQLFVKVSYFFRLNR